MKKKQKNLPASSEKKQPLNHVSKAQLFLKFVLFIYVCGMCVYTSVSMPVEGWKTLSDSLKLE